MISKEELNDFKEGRINIQLNGNIYECIGEQQERLVLSDITDGYSTTRTEEELINDPTSQIELIIPRLYNGRT